MNELSPEAKELLAMASGVDDPSVDDKARVKRAILAAAAVGVVSGASVAAAGTSVGAGSAGVGAAAGSVAAGGSAAAGSAAVGSAAVGSAATVAAGASSMFAAKVAVVLALVGAGAGAVVVSEPWGPSRAPLAAAEREARAVDDDGFVDSRSATAARREVDTEPVDSELVDAVSVDAVPVDTESVDTESVDTEPVDTESVDTESVDTARVELVDEPRRPSGLRSRVSPRVETGDGESGDESGDTLAAELSLLRRARSAHAAGDHTAALAALAEHEAAFPRGVLRAERDGTRALVACAAAPRAETAAEFLRAHPTSPLAARVRAACEVE